MKQPKIDLQEAHKHRGHTFYSCPNESLTVWNKLVGNRRFARTAGISSGGEVGLFVLLPHTRKGGDVVLVDHTPASLACAMGKVALLQTIGGKELHRLITKEVALGPLTAALDTVHQYLPQDSTKWWTRWGYLNSLTRYWRKFITADMAVAAEQKIGQVKFVHGDMRDLADFGPFGCLYLSNALQHSSRFKDPYSGRLLSAPDNTPLLRALTRSGMILASQNTPFKFPLGEPAETARANEEPGWIHWDYLRVEPRKAAA